VHRRDFSAAQQGYLVEIPGGVAFVPPPIPIGREVPRSLLLKDGDARGAVGELVGQSRRLEASLLVAPLRRREAVLSNVIEGTYTQVEDVLLGEAAGETVETAAETTEVIRTVEAIEIGQQWLEEARPLSVSMILELHAALLRHGRGEQRKPGKLRQVQVYLGSHGGRIESARYVPPPWEQVRPLMDDLIAFSTGPAVYGALIDAACIHYQFEAIHPFEDGNGRLGRALIPLFLMTRRVMDKPILYLGAYFAAHRDEYIERLGAVSKQGAWEDWIDFFLEGSIQEARDANQRLRRVDALLEKYRGLLAGASRSAAPLLSLNAVIEKVYVSVGDIAERTGTSVPTARNAIGVLEEVGLLQPGPRVRGKQFWVSREVLDELYSL
jgi:Fic family protein